jgi:SNF2 family DNA or RNA helicase
MKYLFKTEPYQHQRDALQLSWKADAFALFMEMGTGKSKVLIDNLAILFGRGAVTAALIVAPKGVYRNWAAQEIPIHLPDAIQREVAVWSPSPRKAERMALEQVFTSSPDTLKILIMNVEAFSTQKGTDFAQRFILAHRVLLTVDESTTIKNPKARRTKTLMKLAINAPYRRILTGFPITQSPLDLYSQAELLAPNMLGYTSFFSFQNRYAQIINRQLAQRTFRQVVGYQNMEELSEKVGHFSYRVLKKDCLDLPDKVYQRREVALTPEQKRVYKELQEYAIAELEGAEMVSVNSVLTQLLRLHQVVCGYVKNDSGEEVEIPNQRMDELMSVLEEMRGKVIIWANYRHDIKSIVNLLQKTYGVESVASYFGDTPSEERQEIITRFQDPDSKLNYFVGNTQTGGYGITLTQAQNVVYYSNNFDLEKRLQSEDRAHRIGQTNKVTYVDLVAKDTVDEKIVKALRNKLNLAQEVLGDEKWREWIS